MTAMEEDREQKIEIRSEEVQDILGQVPSWIVRWGTVVILATVLILLMGSMIFSYPDKKKADILVTTENPPAPMVARWDGRINLFVTDSQVVQVYDYLAVIQNSAVTSDVVSLQYDMEEIRTIITNLDQEEYIPLNNDYNLGDIQSAHAEFVNEYDNYFDFLERDYHETTIASIQKEIESYRVLNRALDDRVRILRRDVELAQIQFTRDTTVFGKGAIAAADRDRSEQNKLNAESNLAEARQDRAANDITINQLNQRVEQLRLEERKEKEQRKTAVREAFDKLVAEIDIWKERYLLQSPIDGVVSSPLYYSGTQVVRTGETVMTIIPEEPGEIIGKIYLPTEGSGKVKVGQTVNIQFADYPHLQFGMVKGEVRSRSQVPDNDRYVLDVGLPEGLTTYYGYDIDFRQEMMGRAEIITDNRVLISRIFDPIRSIFTEQRETKKAAGEAEGSE
jgi:HlyD family secretion protein